MPFLTNIPDFKFISDPIDPVKFEEAKKKYEDRTMMPINGVDLSKDVKVLYFTAATIELILSKKELIVARFGCEDANSKYSVLTAVLCAMNKSIVDDNEAMYIGTNVIGTPNAVIKDINSWRVKEGNYRARRDILVNSNPNMFKFEMPHGVAHASIEFKKEWFEKAIANKMTDVAIYFIVFPYHTTVAFVDARINLSTLIQYVIYDQGTGCCPA
jgi:hypothetical protein